MASKQVEINSTPTKKPRLRRLKLTRSQKPDVFSSNGHHYFINGVIRNEHFSHITPMTEEQTEVFFADYKILTPGELHAKWADFSVGSTKEVDALIRGYERQTTPDPDLAESLPDDSEVS